MVRSPVVACLMRDLVRGGAVGASVVAAGLLRVADVVLAEESVGKEAGEKAGEKVGEKAGEDVGVGVIQGQGGCTDRGVAVLVSCFGCVVDAVVGVDEFVDGSEEGGDGWGELLEVLDACLLQASGGGAGGLAFLEGVARAGSLGRVRAYLDGVSTLDAVVGDARRVGAVYRLRTRLLLVSGVLSDGKISTATTATRTMTPLCLSIHDVEALVDDVLFWDARDAGDRKLDDRYLAYIAWIACRTLFRRPPPFPVFNPNPLAYSKLLCQAIEDRDCADDGHACFPMVAWALASRVDSAAEQRALLAANTDEFGRRKASLERGAGVMHAWIEAQMLLVGNKLAVDDASRRGIVVGQAQEATLRTIRNLLFPCVLFCPYATLHKLFRLSTANRNDAWMLVAVCELFPDLTDLPSLGEGAAEDGGGTELSRLLIDGVLSGDNNNNDNNYNAASSSSSFLFAARSLFQSLGGSFFHGSDASQKNSPSNQTLWECLPSMLQAPPDRLEVATDFVLDVVRGSHSHSHSHTRLVDRNQHTSIDLISACVSLLDFDTRYRRYSECSLLFSKRSLDNAAKIVETLITESLKFDESVKFDRETLSEIETRSMNPWARLHCGLAFSAAEARYILHTNPKPHPQAPLPPSCSPQNTTLHQTLELAALGSIQRAELQELAAGYTSMAQFLADLQASIRCLFAVCTPTECMHLMTGLELFCTTLVIRTTTTTTTSTTPTAVACACGTAMAVELCLKAALATPTLAPSMIPDICQFCILRVEGTGTGTDDDVEDLPPPALTTRLFSELLTHYAEVSATTNHQPPAVAVTPAVTAALETTLSTLSRRPFPFPPPLDATSILTQTFPPTPTSATSATSAPTPPFILALHSKLATL